MAEHNSRKRRHPAELGPPPRWLNCPRKGSLIAEKFLPFKTPLSEVYDAQVPEESRFPPSMLLDSLTTHKLKMGLWIDLTNTDRFYDPKVIEQRDIRYLKLQCRGHGECPSEDQTKLFIQLCQRFISMNPLHIIGVHCTHGFNRTGFLIASYLVVNMSWSIEAAVRAVAEARPPGIYKADYLRELFKRYGDVDETPPAPPRPSWCDEENEDLDDDGNALGGDGGGDGPVHTRRRREFSKKNPTFMEGVPGVEPITTQPKLLQIQRRCQELCHWGSSGFPGSQPVSMDRENIKLLKEEYMVSWKADGTRYMMLIDGENEVYFIDRDNCVFQVSGLYFPRRKDRSQHIQETLVDGEMIIDKDNGRDVPRYLIYDIIRFQGEEVWKSDFCRRLMCISNELYEPRKAAMQEGRIKRESESFGVRQKQFWDAAFTYKLLSDKFAQSMPHELDGLIFQPKKEPYVFGRANHVLKWKPPHLNTIDFRLKITKETGQGLVPKLIGQLFVGGYDHPYGIIKVNKQLRNMDNKIIECKVDKGGWTLLRERTDKSFPNSFSTAEGVMESIRNPVDKEFLLSVIAAIDAERKDADSKRMPPPQAVAQ